MRAICSTLLRGIGPRLMPGLVTCLLWSQLISEESVEPAQARQPIVVLVLGDSLAAGHGLDPDQAFPAKLQEQVDARGWNAKVINAGVSGDTTAGGLRRLNWLLRQRVDVLLVELGGNDGLRGVPTESTRTNLQAIIDRAKEKYPDIRIVIAGMKMPPNLGEDYAQRFEKVFSDVASENSAALIPFLLEGVGGRPELNQPDRIHPTAEGQAILALNVWKILGPMLEELSDQRAAAGASTEPVRGDSQ